MSLLRKILASWVYAHVSDCLNDDDDIEQNKVDLAVPPPGSEMHRFYTFLLMTETIIKDEVNGDRFQGLIVDEIKFVIPAEDIGKPITWKYLKRLCRLISFYNRMKNDELFKIALDKHVSYVLQNLDALETAEPAYISLLSAIEMNGNLRDTISIFNGLNTLIHRLLGGDDPQVGRLFELNKSQSYVYVNGVIELARGLFEPILQYLPAAEKKSLTILELVSERLPESFLQQTLWKNLQTSPLNETGRLDIQRSRSSKQEQGALCWEFITGLISQTSPGDVLNDEVFKIIDIGRALNLHGVHKRDEAIAGEMQQVHKLSMYSISALLLLSSQTMLRCQCASKTIQFIKLIFSICDENKLKAESLPNSKLLVFATHELAKFPMVRSAERFNFRNIFISYRQADIFERPPDSVFQHQYLTESNFVSTLETCGLKPTYETLFHLLLTLKTDPSIACSDFLYSKLQQAIRDSFDLGPETPNLNDPKVIEMHRSKAEKNPWLKLYNDRIVDAINIFSLSYVYKMTYFASNVNPTHLIPFIQLLDFNTCNDTYPITSAMLQMYIHYLPGNQTSSVNLTSKSLGNQQLGIRIMFKYLNLVVNVMIMERTQGKYTMVDFIEKSTGITLY